MGSNSIHIGVATRAIGGAIAIGKEDRSKPCYG